MLHWIMVSKSLLVNSLGRCPLKVGSSGLFFPSLLIKKLQHLPGKHSFKCFEKPNKILPITMSNPQQRLRNQSVYQLNGHAPHHLRVRLYSSSCQEAILFMFWHPSSVKISQIKLLAQFQWLFPHAFWLRAFKKVPYKWFYAMYNNNA